MRCMRVCPTQAIRVKNQKASFLRDRCIDCGECVRVCPSNAVLPRTGAFEDFSRFTYTIAIPSPVFYSQFGKDVPPSAILAALEHIGFDEAYDAACASESVSIAIEEYLASVESPRPLISPFCPAIVRLIQIRYPNLLEHLIPIESPMEIAAREAKRLAMKKHGLREAEIGVIYVKHSFVNATVAISDIYQSMLHVLPECLGTVDREEVRGLGLGWAVLGGQVACLKAEDCLAIGGLSDAVRIFDEIENGKLRDVQYIEVHSCPPGCAGGSLTVENSYIVRSRVLRMIRRYGGKPCQDREKVRELYSKNFFSLTGKIPLIPMRPLDDDVAKALQKMQQQQQFSAELPQIDCGACGSPTCATFAEDVVRGDAQPEACVFLAMSEFEALSARLREKVGPHGRRKREHEGRIRP
jgi:ferredoxin